MTVSKTQAAKVEQESNDGALTQADYEKLERLAKYDACELRDYTPAEKIDPLETEHTPQPWRLQDGRSTVTIEQCNVVRCAVTEGVSYSRIAELYSFVSDKKHAQRHATGECRHEKGMSPVRSQRRPGPASGSISGTDCAELRRRWEREKFDTYAHAARWLGVARSAAWRHINGECSHD